MKIFDISVPIHPEMHQYPDDPLFSSEHLKSLSKGDFYEYHIITMGNHCGTHIDAPLHFIPGGASVDEIPLEQMNGRCRVIQIHHGEKIDAPELKRLTFHEDFRILFKTRNSLIWSRHDKYQRDYIYLTERAGEYLIENGIKLVGIDYLSVDAPGEAYPVHKLLLQNGIVLLESLNLAEVDEGKYDMSCLPLRLTGMDAAPARVILKR